MVELSPHISFIRTADRANEQQQHRTRKTNRKPEKSYKEDSFRRHGLLSLRKHNKYLLK